MKTRLAALLAFAGALLAGTVSAAPQLDADLRAALQSRVDSNELASVIVGLTDGRDNATYAFFKTGGRAVDAQTIYEIGSVSKTFTGLLLAQAVKSGTARLDQPVAQLLDDYVIPEYKGRPITLLDLATQTSGLPRMPDNIRPARADNPYADYGETELKAFLGNHALTRQPGAMYEYSNVGTGLLGHALAKLANKPYEALIREQIAIPLGMSSTAIALTPSMRARLVQGHTAMGETAANWDMNVLAGSGALRSNAHDMIRYVNAMMTAPSDSAFALARRAQRPTDGKKGEHIGLFWHISTVRGKPVVWHNGMTGGYSSFVGFTGDGKVGIVILTNTAMSLDDVAMAALVPGAGPAMRQTVLAPDVLTDYAGQYELKPGVLLTVTPTATGSLTMQVSGQGKVRAFAVARDEFIARSNGATFSFKRSGNGEVDRVEGRQNGRLVSAKKRVPITTEND